MELTIGKVILFMYATIFPLLVCVIHATHPGLFRRGRITLWMMGATAFSWCFINGTYYLATVTGLYRPRGPEVAFALVFGWMYLWIASIPVMLLYALLIQIRKAANSARAKRSAAGNHLPK